MAGLPSLPHSGSSASMNALTCPGIASVYRGKASNTRSASAKACRKRFASSTRFNDELDPGTVMRFARIYYANIIMPYGRQVLKTLEAIDKLEIDLIAPSHGLMWCEDIPLIIEHYRNWAVHRPEPKVLVMFDSMWGSTDEMARAILQGATIPGVTTELIHVRKAPLSRIATDVLDAAAVAFGSSTLNGGMMPMVSAVQTYLKGLRPAGKACFAFGSYGWSRNGPDDVHEWLSKMNWEILRDPLVCRYRPTDDDLNKCREAGRQLAEQALERIALLGRSMDNKE